MPVWHGFFTESTTSAVELPVTELLTCGTEPSTVRYLVRGDADGNGIVNASVDADFIMTHLFKGGSAPPCRDAADTDDDGLIQLNDAIYLLNWKNQNGPPPPFPFPVPPPPNPYTYTFSDCGYDPTADLVDCIQQTTTCTG